MTKYVQESALNFPLRIMVQERPDGRASIVFDLPSTQIPMQDQFPALKAACGFVDKKIEELMRYVSGPMPEKVMVKELTPPLPSQPLQVLQLPKSQYVPSGRPILTKPLVRYTTATQVSSVLVSKGSRKDALCGRRMAFGKDGLATREVQDSNQSSQVAKFQTSLRSDDLIIKDFCTVRSNGFLNHFVRVDWVKEVDFCTTKLNH